jgi:hypothetical protein
VRGYIKVEDRNRKWEDENMSKHLISSVAESRRNALSATRNGILRQQKEASQAI